MKRVLIFSTAYLPMIGGAEIAVKEITDRLGADFSFSAQGGPASGWEFDLICARIKKELSKRETVGAVNVYRIGWGWGKIDKLLLPWRGAALAAKLYAGQKYDLVWAIMASFGGLAALRFKLKYRVAPYLLTLQEGDAPEHIARRARWLGPYYKKMFTAADFITAISHYLKGFALQNGAKCPIEIVPNGVNLEKFNQAVILSGAKNLKKETGIKENEKVTITVSRLVPKNGVEDLIKAMSYLPVEHKLLILGSGPLENDLKFKIENLKLKDRVLLLGDIPNERVPQYLTIADVFVRPSLSEGLGNSFLEAMAAGVPIIGTRVGGIPDFLEDGERSRTIEPGQAPTGLFCEIKNPQSIADKIRSLLSDDNLRQKLIFNGKKIVSEKYDWDKITKQMAIVFEKLIVKN